ncbi:MAG: hypothetical protein WCD79_20945, partial [Chthoniobacteraceae bacterium]
MISDDISTVQQRPNGGLIARLGSLRSQVIRFGQFRKRWEVLHGLALAVLALPGALLAWFAL